MFLLVLLLFHPKAIGVGRKRSSNRSGYVRNPDTPLAFINYGDSEPFCFKGSGCQSNSSLESLGQMSVWFGEHQIAVRGSNSEYQLQIYSRS